MRDEIFCRIGCVVGVDGDQRGQLDGKIVKEVLVASELPRLAEVLKAAAQYAATAGTVAVEPLNRFEYYILNTAAADLNLRVSDSNYGYRHDTFDFSIEVNSVSGVIDPTSRAIKHIHISDNTRVVPRGGSFRLCRCVPRAAQGRL